MTYTTYIHTDGLLLYGPGREILLYLSHTLMVLPRNLLFSSEFLDDLLQTCQLPAVILSAQLILQPLEDSSCILLTVLYLLVTLANSAANSLVNILAKSLAALWPTPWLTAWPTPWPIS